MLTRIHHHTGIPRTFLFCCQGCTNKSSYSYVQWYAKYTMFILWQWQKILAFTHIFQLRLKYQQLLTQQLLMAFIWSLEKLKAAWIIQWRLPVAAHSSVSRPGWAAGEDIFYCINSQRTGLWETRSKHSFNTKCKITFISFIVIPIYFLF